MIIILEMMIHKPPNDSNEPIHHYCYCQQVSYSEMVTVIVRSNDFITLVEFIISFMLTNNS